MQESTKAGKELGLEDVARAAAEMARIQSFVQQDSSAASQGPEAVH
jgi:hypothetical protein